MKHLKYTIVIAAVFSFLFLSGCGETVKTTKLVSAEKAGWTLAFHDDFERDKIGNDWQVVEGNWAMKDGSLRGGGTIVSAKKFMSGSKTTYLRMEFEAATDIKPFLSFKNGPDFKVVISDMSSFLHIRNETKRPFEDSYFFQFGGFNNKRNSIKKSGLTLAVDKDPKLILGQNKPHKVIVENDKGTLRLFVDGKLALETIDNDKPLTGPRNSRVGFYFYTAVRIFDVKIYVK